mmetsp:Transcript_38721/g.66967  ORF Transcript_38721/g.66967 Transcript_38721/m.66967 type:complete len:211 (-) Transcript_38721:11-643(-)
MRMFCGEECALLSAQRCGLAPHQSIQMQQRVLFRQQCLSKVLSLQPFLLLRLLLRLQHTLPAPPPPPSHWFLPIRRLQPSCPATLVPLSSRQPCFRRENSPCTTLVSLPSSFLSELNIPARRNTLLVSLLTPLPVLDLFRRMHLVTQCLTKWSEDPSPLCAIQNHPLSHLLAVSQICLFLRWSPPVCLLRFPPANSSWRTLLQQTKGLAH